MQILIEIPDEMYADIKEGYSCAEYGDELVGKVKDGMPLPKGHGDLIDRSKIEWYGCDFESDKNCNKANNDCSMCFFAECSHDQVMRLSAVIPAEKEGDSDGNT